MQTSYTEEWISYPSSYATGNVNDSQFNKEVIPQATVSGSWSVVLFSGFKTYSMLDSVTVTKVGLELKEENFRVS